MVLLTQNTKMKKSSQNGITNVNWTIPAFQSATGLKTCPNAGLCAAGCYARQGAYMFGNVKRAHEEKLALTQTDTFVGAMVGEIDRWLKMRKVGHLKVRIHDAGDFYSKEYASKWFAIMRHFENHLLLKNRVSFYAYTKQVKMFQSEMGTIPSNFTLIYSFGGRQDALIDVSRDRHARVFETIQDLESAGYQNGTDDDMVAAMGNSIKIGLCYHGTKLFTNTKWDKVA